MVEAFYEPSWQFPFEKTGTKIKTPSGVYVPDEKPNYRMTLHRVGIGLSGLPRSRNPAPLAAGETLPAPRS